MVALLHQHIVQALLDADLRRPAQRGQPAVVAHGHRHVVGLERVASTVTATGSAPC